MRCAAHTLNLVCAMDADNAVHVCSIYGKISKSAFAKAQGIWNKQSRKVHKW